MKRLFSWLVRPIMLSLLGVILLSLLIWFEAPLLAFDGKEPFASERVRWISIILFFLLWSAYFVGKYIAARIASTRLMQGVAGQAEAVPGTLEARAEIDVLGKRMQEAQTILRKSRPGGRGGSQYMYQLPWYMFVGAPGSGKTTALVQSGLTFPLAEAMGKSAIGGIGGTRNCDWWFTDEAVLLDTAGRYTTQDSYTEVDRAAWSGFLQLLRKHRRRRPLNGVILAVSAADLLQQSEAGRVGQAQAIRTRIKELHEQLGMRFPIYVMVTKSDLLAGFTEFFDNMGKEERAQVWGVTFPLAEGNQVDRALTAFPGEFALLEAQLQVRLLDRMQQERDVQRRTLMYSFPQQFACMGEALQQFLNEIFQSSRYEESALLRGVYFTSGTQEGSPIDRVMGAMAAAFGLERQVLPMNAASGRSYFITRLLREVIFPEAELAGVNLQLERKRRWLQWGGVVGTGVLTLLLAAALTNSYLSNRTLVDSVRQEVVKIEKLAVNTNPNATALSVLPLLNAVRDLPGGYAAKDDDAPLLMRLGLNQGDKLGAGAQSLYRKTLRATLLPRIAARMEQQLRRGNANNPDYLYEVLRVYLMLGDASHFEAASIQAWVDYDWERTLEGSSAAQRQDLSGHVQAMLETFHEADTTWQLDTQLISDTRLALAQMPLAQRIYNRLKREMAQGGLPEFSIAIAGGRDAPQVFVRKSGEPLTRGIPGMYSVAGFARFEEQSKQAMTDLSKDGWVLARQEAAGVPGSNDQIAEGLLQLYYNDYIALWDALLADVAVAPFVSLDAGARITNALSGAESPLRKFLQAAAKETTLEGTTKPSTRESVTDAVKNKLDTYKKKLESAMGGGADDGMPAAPKALNPVDLHFEGLHKLVSAPSGVPAPLESVLAMLKDVAAYLDMAAAAKRAGTPAPAGDALIKLKREADGKPAPLAAMLKNIDSGGAGLTLGSERERLNALWVGAAGQFCRQAIAGRYPLVRSATQEVTADDFGKFFAPGGLVDDFFQRNLMPYVDMGSRQWRWRATAENASLGMPQEVLNQFQRAAELRDSFFGSGGKQPSMRFELKPLSVDDALSKVMLDIDGQAVQYGMGSPARAVAIQLPSGKGGGQVRFEVTPSSPSSNLHTEGVWAWLRMIDKGVLEGTAQGERFKLTFNFDGRKLVYGLTASSVINPFRREALERFKCMDRL